ncbi:histidine phosphatase family protein [Paenibacillus sp. FSL R7-0652]|uniref:Histidine phosphatase family protein n=1 Tax=Paenibacillus sp. AN1007 TaxID=3151385 RepID=A0AAU8N7L4_9BACL
MSTTFYLVRHGIKKRDIGDVPLTPEGSRQAELTARHFASASYDIHRIVASPLRRAQETAQAIASLTQSDVTEDARLRERANWGDVPEQTFEQFVDLWNQCTADPEFVPPVGDSAKQAGTRLASLLNELAAQEPPGSHIVLATHGGLITDFLVQTFSEEELNRWHPNFLVMQNRLVPECSITKLIYHDGQYTLESFASAAHLTENNEK